MIKYCKYCGNTIPKNTKATKFCSAKHATEYHWKIRNKKNKKTDRIYIMPGSTVKIKMLALSDMPKGASEYFNKEAVIRTILSVNDRFNYGTFEDLCNLNEVNYENY